MKILNKLVNLISYKEQNNYSFILPDANRTDESQKDRNEFQNNDNIYPSLDVNKEYIKSKYSFQIKICVNGDVLF